jgi:hypothetical protein
MQKFICTEIKMVVVQSKVINISKSLFMDGNCIALVFSLLLLSPLYINSFYPG